MADFCYDCSTDAFAAVGNANNDFQRDNVGWTRWKFHICEGCGAHLFDHHGRRMCLTGLWPARVPAPMPGQCAGCSALADAVSRPRRWGLLARCRRLGSLALRMGSVPARAVLARLCR